MSHEFREFFNWINSFISILIFLSFIIISYFSDVLFQIPSKETITETINDSDSHSIRFNIQLKVKKKRLNKITKLFNKLNKIIPEGIFESKKENFFNFIQENSENKEKFMKDILMDEKKFK